MSPPRPRRALILVADQFEDLELHYPRYRLLEAGFEVKVAGLGEPEYRGKRGTTIRTDAAVDAVVGETWDVVVVPGGWAPDKLRTNAAVKRIVQDQDRARRPLVTICHGGWVLASAGIVKGRTMTAVPAIWDDLRNAGANVVDREVVVDGHVVSSRRPEDLPAFMRETLRLLEAAPIAKAA